MRQNVFRVVPALLLLAALPAAAAVAFDNFHDGGYQGGGVHTTTIVATGVNLACVVITWHRSGTVEAPVCGGFIMTQVATASVTQCLVASVETWLYAGPGLVAGTLTVSVNASVESVLEVLSFSGVRQTSVPDAVAAFVAGVEDGLAEGALPVTTVANGSLVVGAYCSGVTMSTTPSTTGRFVGRDFAVGFYLWVSGSPVAAAGAFTLQARGASPGAAFDAVGLSLAPVPAAVMVPRRAVIIH